MMSESLQLGIRVEEVVVVVERNVGLKTALKAVWEADGRTKRVTRRTMSERGCGSRKCKRQERPTGTGPSRTLQGFSARDEGENVEGGNKQRQTLTAHPSRSTLPVDDMPKLAAGELPSFLPLLAGLCLFLGALAWQTRPSRPLVSECSSASLSDISPSAVRAAPPTAALHARAVHSRDP